MQKKLVRRALCLLGVCVAVSGQAFSQSTPVQTLQQSFETYAQQTAQEKVYLHTDRSAYLAGETMWFKAYLVEAARHYPSNLSKVLYIEVLNQEQVPMLQTKLAISQGTGNGFLEVPPNLPSGNYVLRAYTNWMKNAGAAFFYEKPISVINTFRPFQVPAIALSVEFDTQFFPEGGQLVNGLPSKVAFRVVDKNGKGGSFVGSVLNAQNDTIAQFYTYKFGIGSFAMTPQAGQTYRAVFKGPNGQMFTQPLPRAQENGTVLAVMPNGPDNLQVKVQQKGVGQGNVHLLVHTRQQVAYAQTQPIDAQGAAIFSVSKKELAEGVSHFTVFNEQQKPVAERLYFKRPQEGVLQLNAQMPQREFRPRAQVNVAVEAKNRGQLSASADVSMAVFRVDSLQTVDPVDMVSYFWLSADLKGNIESADYYLTATGPEVETATDHLMLTHGWRRFTWQDALAPSGKPVTYLPEIAGHLVHAKLTDRVSGKPAPNVLSYLTVPARTAALYGARSNAKGQVLFDVLDLYGTHDLVLQADTRRDSTIRFEIIDPFSAEPMKTHPAPLRVTSTLLPSLAAKSLHLQVQSFHTAVEASQFTGPAVDTTNFYGTADRKYLLDEFTRFPAVEDVMREYVPSVLVRKRSRKFSLAVIDQYRKESFSEEPLVLLDGVPVFSTDSIMTYDPKNIRQLDVVSRKYYHGPMTFSGIVSFSTYAGNLKGFPIDARALLVEYQGLQRQREFFSPQYGTEAEQSSRLPDLRTLLYWAPTLQTDAATGKQNVQFFTSDQKGKYQVVVQGITPDGKVGYTTQTFVVK